MLPIFKLILLTTLFSFNIFAATQIRNDTLEQPAYGECISPYWEKKWGDKCQNVKIFKYYGPRWKEMKQFFLDFQQALEAEDKAKVASMIEYPIKIDYTKAHYNYKYERLKTLTIYNKDAFIENYDFIFNTDFKNEIINVKYKNLIVLRNSIKTGPCSCIKIVIVCSKIGDNHNTCIPYSIKVNYIHAGYGGTIKNDD